MTDDSWQLQILCPVQYKNPIQNLCWEHNCVGISEPGRSDIHGFYSYFKNETDFLNCRNCIEDYSRNVSIQINMTTEKCSNQYLTKWHEYFRPVKIGGKITIFPPWDIPPDDGSVQIKINPGQSFGTGSHESTTLVLETLISLPLYKSNILDVGCGSGILGISAAKLAFCNVTMMDIDPIAIQESRINAGLNDICLKKYIIGTPETLSLKTFDIVLANLDYKTLDNYASLLPRLLKTNGYLVISGFLQCDEKALKSEFLKEKIRLEKSYIKDEWMVFVLQTK